MAVSGPGPVQSDNASAEYQSILRYVVRRVNACIQILAEEDRRDGDQGALAAVYALRLLASAVPLRGGERVFKGQVAEWREQYFRWFDKATIPKKHRDALRRTAEAEFSQLEEVAGIGPKWLWIKD